MRIGIAFSGGGSRGIAHVGALKALHELDIVPQIVTGTSAGSIVGVLYAFGYEPGEIMEIILKTRLLRILRPAFTRAGLLTLEKTYDFFKSILPTDSFESLKIPLYICATNLKNGQATFFSSGSLIRSVMASSAIPVIFSPVEIDGTYYIDGGITNNLPVEPLIGSCDKIIGIHCNPVDLDYRTGNMKELLERTFLIAINENVEKHKDVCDILLEPYELRKFGALDFAKAKDIFKIGYEYVLKNEKRLLALNE
jgi:NTE family protein